jgi:LCP family protein required for cell wall assembly
MRSGDDFNRHNDNGYYTDEDFERDFYGETEADDRARALGIYDDFEKKSSRRRKSKKSGGKRPKKKRDKKKTAIIVISCMIALVLACLALGYGFLHSKLNEVNRVDVSDEDWDIDPEVAKQLKDYKNILLIGIDAREGEDADKTRSDGIIIMTINKKTKDISLTSVMRDTYLDMEVNEQHTIDKITHAHAYGGPVNTVRALNRNMDLNIDDFMRVDWSTVADVTNAMGGIKVEVKEKEIKEINKFIKDTNKNLSKDQKDNTMIKHAGKQTLKGVQIVSYCRIRKIDGDKQRTQRMRNTIKGAFEKAKTLKLSELSDVADVAMSETTTSMGNTTMISLISGMTKYDMKGSKSWPYNAQSVMIGGVYYDTPITLKSNVVDLHKKVFKQKNYKPTTRCLRINEQIKAKSGRYGDEGINYDYLD